MESSIDSKAGSTTTIHFRKHRCLNRRDWLELLSNAAIPLMIGVVSLWIDIHQQNVAQANRDKDATQVAEVRKQDVELTRLQREEDRETARLQRAEDKETARLQREGDQKTSHLQREEDRETARLQRELDLNVTYAKRIQDNELAEKERNLSETQRAQEFRVAHQSRMNDLMLEDDRQKESVLLEYQDDLATLMFEYGSLLRDPQSKWWFIIQMKTGAALRQLDPARRTILVHTLLDAGILDVNAKNELSIVYMANVSGVEFGRSLDTYSNDSCTAYEYLHIGEADVRYASFYGVCFTNSPSFAFSDLDHTDWSFATLYSIHFDDEMTMNGAKFAGSILKGVIFNKSIAMNQVSFQHNTICSHCKFMKTSLLGVRLDHSNFLQSTFSSLSMADGNMSNGSFIASIFDRVILDRVDLSGANLQACEFVYVSMINCSMSKTKLDQVKFSNVDMTGCTGLTYEQLSVISKLYKTTLPEGIFMEEREY